MAKKTYTAEELQEFEKWLDNERLADTRERRFYLACLTDDLDTIIALKDQIDITAHNDLAVRWAAQEGYLGIVQYLHEQGADICTDNNIPLYLASSNGHLDVVKYLHGQGADICARRDMSIRYAAEGGRLDVVKYLHEHGADICADDDCALRWASTSGHVPVVRYILSVVPDIKITEKIDFRNWKDEHLKELFSMRFMMQNPFIAQRVWDIVPQDQKTPTVIQHYQQNIKLLLLRHPLQQKLAVG